MVGLFLRCLDPQREGAPLYRHATSEGCNHQAGPSHRQPPLSRTQPLRSGSNRTRWRCRCSPCRRGSGSSHRTPLHQLGRRPRRQLSQRHRRKHRQRNRRPAVLFPRPHQLGGQSTRASHPLQRCRRTRQRRRHSRPAILLPLLRRRRGRLERSRQQLGPLMTAGRGRSAMGVCDFIPEREYRCGDCHLGRAPFRGVRRPARVWHIRGAGGDIATRDQHYLGQVGIFLEE